MTLLGLMDIVCTKETVSFIKRASKLYSFDWEESRVLSLLLGRGYLLFGESSNSAPKPTLKPHSGMQSRASS